MAHAAGRVGLAIAVLLLLGVPGEVFAGDDDAGRTRSLLAVVRKDAEPKAWAEAVRELETGTEDQRRQLHALLRRMAESRRGAWTRAASSWNALAARMVPTKRSEKQRLAWEKAREHANAWLFDEDAFPDPGAVVIGGPTQGYRQAKQRGDEAIHAYRALRRSLDAAVRPALSLSPKKAKALIEAHDEAASACRRVIAALPEDLREGLEHPSVEPLAVCLSDLALRQFTEAAEAYAELSPGWHKLCLFHAYGRALQAWNEERPFGMEAGALAGLRIINEYRMALGISPVAHCERLVRAAHGHSKEMAERGYFSHRSPVPERATKEKRAALEGYTARIAECITGAGGGNAAIEFWKYDGGHHRDMIHPMYVESGFSTRGPAVYVTGRGDEGHVPGIRY